MFNYMFSGPGSIRLFILELLGAGVFLAVSYGLMLMAWAVWGGA